MNTNSALIVPARRSPPEPLRRATDGPDRPSVIPPVKRLTSIHAAPSPGRTGAMATALILANVLPPCGFQQLLNCAVADRIMRANRHYG